MTPRGRKSAISEDSLSLVCLIIGAWQGEFFTVAHAPPVWREKRPGMVHAGKPYQARSFLETNQLVRQEESSRSLLIGRASTTAHGNIFARRQSAVFTDAL